MQRRGSLVQVAWPSILHSRRLTSWAKRTAGRRAARVWPMAVAAYPVGVVGFRLPRTWECGGVEWYCRSTPTKERYVMSEEPISLGALAYASNLYNAMTDFGSSFREFQHRVHGKPDLDDPDPVS